MPTSRREFIKLSFGAVSISLMMPEFLKGAASAQTPSNPNRRILIVIQMAGGNDGLNTVIPYTDSRYRELRPTLGFKEKELKDRNKRSTVITEQFAFHPSMGKLKELYDAKRIAIVLGVGYPSPDLSHFTSTKYWETARFDGSGSEGWIGRYLDQAAAGASLFPAVSLTGGVPKSLLSKVTVPALNDFSLYSLKTDAKYEASRTNRIDALDALNNRDFNQSAFPASIGEAGISGVRGALQLSSQIPKYASSVTYPVNPFASSLKKTAQLITTMSDVDLIYVTITGFDTHAQQIGADKLSGVHSMLMEWFSEGLKAFYDDINEHGLADNVLMMTWSEFGRRPNENGSLGTDHGTAAPIFLIGNPVIGGLYGEQPSLAATDRDLDGNLKFTVDFRSVYGTVLDRWLGADSESVLGGRYPNVGFLGS